MGILFIILLVIISYFIGSIPFGYLISKLFKEIDIRKYGSHNIGATNVFRVVGKRYGIACLILDILKGLIPVIVFSHLYFQFFNPSITLEWSKILIGLATLSGHIWPVYLNFKGGKGVATSFGVLLGMVPKIVLISLGIWFVTVLISRTVSLGSILAALSLPFIEAFCGVSITIIIFTIVIVLLVIFRHRENMERILQGKEKSF